MLSCPVVLMSLPSRGAWIEIRPAFAWWAGARVAPLAGSVDRNLDLLGVVNASRVAPLAGSVDRNIMSLMNNNDRQAVAPLAGSVDRNITAIPWA